MSLTNQCLENKELRQLVKRFNYIFNDFTDDNVMCLKNIENIFL